jgi:hypothetical protein
MGYANSELIRLCERARKRGWKEVQQLGKLVEESQAACPHKKADRKIVVVRQDWGKLKKGGTTEFCLRCSKLILYTPPKK